MKGQSLRDDRIVTLLILLMPVLALLVATGCSPGPPQQIINQDQTSAVAIQSDGKIVAAGTGGLYGQVALARYNTNGTLDATFGSGGKVATNQGNAADIAIQSDGKIVAAGTWYSDAFALMRFNSNGTVDSAFGSWGALVIDAGTGAGVSALAIQSDGRIVAVGYSYNGGNTNYITTGLDFVVVRCNSNGTLDQTFGSSGKVVTAGLGRAQDVAIQADGKILVAGGYHLARYNSDGTPDVAFGTNGTVSTSSVYYDLISAVAVQADGKIIVAGNYYNASSYGHELALRRYNSDGSPDSTFGTAGMAIIPASLTNYYYGSASVLPQIAGKIVAAGFAGSNYVGLARYSSGGTPDLTFSSDGRIVTNAWEYWSSFCDGSVSDVAVQADGKIVVVGTGCLEETGRDFGLVRYNMDGSLDTTFGNGGRVITAF